MLKNYVLVLIVALLLQTGSCKGRTRKPGKSSKKHTVATSIINTVMLTSTAQTNSSSTSNSDNKFNPVPDFDKNKVEKLQNNANNSVVKPASPPADTDNTDSDDDADDGSIEQANLPILIVHEQPDVMKIQNKTLEDGYFPTRDEWVHILDRTDENPDPYEQGYERAIELAYLIRERQDDESCKTSVAACEQYTSMWPQIDGLCDLFFVKCLIEVAGTICRNYTSKDIFKHAPDLCDNVSDFCTQNREAVIAFCWGLLYQRYGEISMNPQPPKTKFNKFMEGLI